MVRLTVAWHIGELLGTNLLGFLEPDGLAVLFLHWLLELSILLSYVLAITVSYVKVSYLIHKAQSQFTH